MQNLYQLTQNGKGYEHHTGALLSFILLFQYVLWTHTNPLFSQQHCFWSSGRDIELPMCANGKFQIGVRRR